MRNILVLMMLGLFLSACTGGPSMYHYPMSKLDLAPAGFDLRVKEYQRKDGDKDKQEVESGVVPLERAGIDAIKSHGYTYMPGDQSARYLVEVHMFCWNPRDRYLTATNDAFAMEPLYFHGPVYGTVPVFPSETYVWSPEIQQVQHEKSSCTGQMRVIVHDRNYRTSLFIKDISNVGCPTVQNCPFTSCQNVFQEEMTGYLNEVFSK